MVINNGNCDPAGFPTLETTACDSRGILKLNQSLIINKCDLNDLYRMDKGAPFATGLYAQVRRCKSLRPNGSQKSSQSYYAAKFSPRKRPGHPQNEDCVESLHEIALLCQLKNPYIISFKDAFILDDFIVTIMEFAPGGDLQSVIDADLVLLEKDASRYVYQLLEALKYLHSRHIAHLDIKPQNLLLMGEFPSCDIKLCDFEISRVIRPGMEIREILGTPDYVAPEILLYEPLSTLCDMWSVGILTYVLLTGFSPFGGDTDQETFRNIINEPIDFPEELFEDVSPAAIDFIEKLAVKTGRTRPTAQDMELHEWVRSYVDPSIIASSNQVIAPAPVAAKEPTPEPAPGIISATYGGCGPKKRSPRKASAMSNCSTASASPAGRRHTARAILRACKSAYDLNKMGGKTKSREALIEKMRIATGEPSGGPWKLRKNLSKSREQLWESKIQLSKSCERINIFPGSTRWASVANFPSLDMNTMKSATSQESVISVMSTSTNVGNAQQQLEMSDWQQAGQDETFPYSVSMPSTPPVPNFDLSHNNGYHESSPPIINNFTGLQPKLSQNGEFSGYPSLQSSSVSGGDSAQFISASQAAANAAIEEAQKSVAELIMTFGGRVSKKLDLKNKFEPIMEVDGSEEQPMSLGDCSDNNSTSGVSSIIPTSNNGNLTTNIAKQLDESSNNNHNGKINSSNNNNNTLLSATNKMDTGQEPGSANSSRRNSKTAQQIQDEIKSSEKRHSSRGPGPDHHNATSTRRGSMSPPKNSDGTTLKGILKKPKPQVHQDQMSAPHHHHPRPPSEFPNTSSARRGSIPSNCFRLYEQHTISSSAKVPKKSILKNSNRSSTVSPARSTASHNISSNSASAVQGGSKNSSTMERSSSKSPENNSQNSSPAKQPATNPKDEQGKEEKNENSLLQSTTATSGNTSASTNTSNAPVQLRQSRPTSVLITSNADNKLDVELRAEPRRRPRPVSTDCSTYVISPEKEKQFEKEIKAEVLKSRQQARKRNEHSNLESNKYLHNNKAAEKNSINNNNNNSSNNAKLGEAPPPAGDGTEPAAVAIKVFPPDPIIIPKSSALLLTSGKSPDSPGTEVPDIAAQVAVAAEYKEYAKRNSTSSTSSSTSTTSTTVVSTKQMKTGEGMKSQWGVVCTGSVERAKERFESVRSKLRRGSVPDF